MKNSLVDTKVEELFKVNEKESDWQNWKNVELLKIYYSTQSEKSKLKVLELFDWTIY